MTLRTSMIRIESRLALALASRRQGGGSAVTDVTGTAPIIATPSGTTRVISIRASSPTQSGSMSAAQAQKLADLTPTSPLVADLDADGFGIEDVRTLTFRFVDNGNSGAAKAIDWSAGGKQKLTLTANCSITFSAPPPGGVGNLQLQLVQGGGGGFTPSFASAGVRWVNSTVPTFTTAAGGVDWVSFLFTPGPFYDGQLSPNFG